MRELFYGLPGANIQVLFMASGVWGGNAAGIGAIFNTKCQCYPQRRRYCYCGDSGVQGELDVGSMIGINILAPALQPILAVLQLGTSFTKANQSLAMFEEFSRMPLEKESGSTLTDYAGGLELRDLAFSYPGVKTRF